MTVHSPEHSPELPETSAGEHCLRIHRVGIDTYQEPVVFLRADSHVCRAEGFEAQSRVELRLDGQHLVATLNVVHAAGAMPLALDQAGLSESAWHALGGSEGDRVRLSHPTPVES